MFKRLIGVVGALVMPAVILGAIALVVLVGTGVVPLKQIEELSEGQFATIRDNYGDFISLTIASLMGATLVWNAFQALKRRLEKMKAEEQNKQEA